MKRYRYLYISFLFIFSNSIALSAKTKAKSPSAEELWTKSMDAYFNYDFEEASDLLEDFRELKTKAKQDLGEEYYTFENQLEIALNAFDRVQQIQIIDSISLPRSAFYKKYKLAASAGRIGNKLELGIDPGLSGNEPGYVNESEEYFIGVATNKEGETRLWESIKLLDDTWENYESLSGDFEKTGDYAFPFMSSDGQTLYFANDGEGSMGGFDLFVAQRDPITGEFLQPLNLGMPFNSPYDDLMYAIDEENGLGWWATDRNSPDGNVTVYTFILDETRKNYPRDTENLVELAQVASYKDTWEEGKEKEYQEKINKLPKFEDNIIKKDKIFEFPLGNGTVYFNYSNFKNKKSSDLMKQYLKLESEIQNKEVSLEKFRTQYGKDKSLASKITILEKEIETDRNHLKSLSNEIRGLEKTQK